MWLGTSPPVPVSHGHLKPLHDESMIFLKALCMKLDCLIIWEIIRISKSLTSKSLRFGVFLYSVSLPITPFFLYSFSFFVITTLFLLLSIFPSLFFISASRSHLSFLLLLFFSSSVSFIHSEKAWLCSDLYSFCFLSFIYSISLPLSLSLSFLPFPVVSFWLSVLLSLSLLSEHYLSLSQINILITGPA